MSVRDPLRDFEALRRDIERVFDRSGISMLPSRWRQSFLPGRSARHYPLLNLHDDGENFYVEALAPGIDPENLDVTVVKSTLTISGEKAGPTDLEADRIHRSERAAGRFMRTLDLPVEIDVDNVDAEYRRGLLLLTLPRAESARPRRVEIQAS